MTNILLLLPSAMNALWTRGSEEPEALTLLKYYLMSDKDFLMILKLIFLGEKDKESQKWSALDEFSKPENAKIWSKIQL